MFSNAKKLSKVLIKLEANLEQIWSKFGANLEQSWSKFGATLLKMKWLVKAKLFCSR
jgi:hypothetical protein